MWHGTIFTLAFTLAADRGAASAKSSGDEAARLELARKIEEAAAKRDAAALDALMDEEALCDAVTRGASAPEDFRKEFRQGFAKQFSLSKHIFQALGEKGTYNFLRIREVGGKPRLLFRLLMADGTVTYHELLCAKDAAGRLKMVDLYAYGSGKLSSETLRRLYLYSAAQKNQGFLDKLFGKEAEFVKNMEKLTEMNRLRQDGKFEEGLKMFAGLPASLKKEKFVLLLRLLLAQKASPEAYRKALAEFEKAFPNDPALDLHSFDSCFLSKKYDEALQVLDRLDRRLGGDPYLKVLRASVHIEAGSLEKARDQGSLAVQEEPALEDAYWTLVTISLRAKDFKETVALLQALEEKFKVKIGNLHGKPIYEEFVRSAEYEGWMKKRRKS